MRFPAAIVLRRPPLDVADAQRLLSNRTVCYDYQSCGEVSERLKELASKASVGETLPWVQIPPSPPFFCAGIFALIQPGVSCGRLDG